MFAQLVASTPMTLLILCASTTSALSSPMLQTSSVSTTQPTTPPLSSRNSASSPFLPPITLLDTLLSTEAKAPTLALTTLFPTVLLALLSVSWKKSWPCKDTETNRSVHSPSLLTSLKCALSTISQGADLRFPLVISRTTLRETVSSPVVKISKQFSVESITTLTNQSAMPSSVS